MLLKDYKLTQDEFNQIMIPFALDLQAYYNIMQEAILKMIDIAVEKNWTPEKLIQEISHMFEEGGNKYLHEESVNKDILSTESSPAIIPENLRGMKRSKKI